ncbi:hypothetical protein EJ03DRAFT_98632 [Teratosphaeria nubilosa]|uniref:Uncharacterized protein n=1 Tax=Teratosphaeria nubilosa TaxID=161662 RepID=A0A6G1L8Q3_9PEZI|nr:hypothetical protein EJ03DRAFT_98632 [Teratosphaeria nubilosa]
MTKTYTRSEYCQGVLTRTLARDGIFAEIVVSVAHYCAHTEVRAGRAIILTKPSMIILKQAVPLKARQFCTAWLHMAKNSSARTPLKNPCTPPECGTKGLASGNASESCRLPSASMPHNGPRVTVCMAGCLLPYRLGCLMRLSTALFKARIRPKAVSVGRSRSRASIMHCFNASFTPNIGVDALRHDMSATRRRLINSVPAERELRA